MGESEAAPGLALVTTRCAFRLTIGGSERVYPEGVQINRAGNHASSGSQRRQALLEADQWCEWVAEGLEAVVNIADGPPPRT